MTRKPHYIKHNDRSETLHACVFYDTETETWLDDEGRKHHRLVFGWGAFTRRIKGGKWSTPEWIRFTKGEQLWKWITSKTRQKITLYVFAHNHSFDYCTTSGPSELSGLGYQLMNAIVDSPPFVMKWSLSSRKLVLSDTLNLWRMSLEQMGKLTGLEKLKMPQSWTGAESDDAYCKRDVEIIMHAVCEWADFLRAQDMGKICLTVAAQAMQTFRHRYLTDSILVDVDDTALRVSRSAYHGGRVECFFIGRVSEPLWLLDINSLYPHVMREQEYPLRLIRVLKRQTVDSLWHLLNKYLVCAHVTVQTEEPCVARVQDGKLCFPTGCFDAYISSPEVEYLLRRGDVCDVHTVAVYEKGRPFVAFVDDLYSRRQAAADAGNKVLKEHYKLILNSFSGKWGQNGIKWETVGRTHLQDIAFWRSIDAETLEVANFRRFNGLVQVKRTFPESRESCPAIAAHITAYGRMMLWALIRQVGRKNCLYCDTDSVLVTEDGFKQVEQSVSDRILGRLKIVGNYAEAVLYGAKDYTLDGKPVIKGIRKLAKQIAPNTYEQERWLSFTGLLREGSLDSAVTHNVTKTLRRVYGKGIVQYDGSVLPLRPGELWGGASGVS